MAWLQALLAGLFAAAALPAPAGVVVTEDDPSLPPGCRPADVARLARARDPRLTEVIVGYANGLGQIEFRLGGRRRGKGVVDCEERRIVAWGAGPSSGEPVVPLCRPAGGTAAVRACVRHWR
jgi:hypothetical protein